MSETFAVAAGASGVAVPSVLITAPDMPPRLTKPEFAPSQDPPGFDREARHETLNAGVLALSQRVL